MGGELGDGDFAADPGLDVGFVVEAVAGEDLLAQAGEGLVKGPLAGGGAKAAQATPLVRFGADGEDEEGVLGDDVCARGHGAGGEGAPGE